MQDAVAEGVRFVKGRVRRKSHHPKLRALLVFALYSQVVNLIHPHPRVGEDHNLRSAPVARAERRGNRPGIQIRQRRIPRYVQVYVRVQVARRHRRDAPDPAAREVRGQKGNEGDIAAIGQTGCIVREKRVGKNIEAPLVGPPVGRGRQLKVRSHPLFEQRHSVGQTNQLPSGRETVVGPCE